MGSAPGGRSQVRQNPRGRAALLCLGFVLAGCEEQAPYAGVMAPVLARPIESQRVLTVDRGETLGDILLGVVPASEWGEALTEFRDHADPRRIRAGSKVTVRTGADENDVRGLEVALNPDESLVLVRQRLDGERAEWSGELVSHPLGTDTVMANGVIENDLWRAVTGVPELGFLSLSDRARFIHELDQIFQWQIDFTVQIRRGDRFRFVAERSYRLDGSTRSVRILSAEIVNSGSPFTAVWFDPNDDGRGSYFDVEGESVRRAFLLRPLEYRRISSRFTLSRYHPVLKRWRAHRGVDYAADRGTPVMATGSGVVVSAGERGALGKAVVIRHPSGFQTRYGHLSGFARGVTAGSPVSQGQVVGYVGMTGLATGYHLHYEMLRSGRHVDPLSVDLPADDPVPDEVRSLWEARRDASMELLRLVDETGTEEPPGSRDETRTAGRSR